MERRARGGRFLWFLAAALAGAAGCGGPSGNSRPVELVCYVGGTMRPAVEELVRRFEAKTGIRVNTDAAGSGELLARIELGRRGDLYVAHDPFLAVARSKGHAVRGWVLASVTPVIVVRKGNPKGIRGFRDLARQGVKVVLTDANLSTAGWIVRVVARRAGVEKALEANVVTRARGGSAAAEQVVLGTADAAVCWNAVAKLREKDLDAVPIEPEFLPKRDVDAVTSATFGTVQLCHIRVTVCTLKYSKHLEEATAFAEFCASKEAAAVWKRFGFSPADPSRGDEPRRGL